MFGKATINKNKFVWLAMRASYFVLTWVIVIPSYVFNWKPIQSFLDNDYSIGDAGLAYSVGVPTIMVILIYSININDKSLSIKHKLLNVPALLFFLWQPYKSPRLGHNKKQ